MASWMQPGNTTEFRMVGILHVALFVKNAGTLFAGKTGEPTGGNIKGPTYPFYLFHSFPALSYFYVGTI